jgi:malonyl CoA-acyl carrier protein transacylase
MINKTALVFPAFISEFTEKELSFLKENKVSISDYINSASEIVGYNLPDFTYANNEYINSEFLSQLIAFVFSCSINDALVKREIKPHFVAGYSMGIYAALYSSKSISFIDGIKIIKTAFDITDELRTSGLYGMGSIIGLSENDVKSLIDNNQQKLEIININNEHSLVIAGEKKEIKKLLIAAKNEGAISVSELTVNTPYHSELMLRYSEVFEGFIDSLSIKSAVCPLISTYDQREIREVSDIKKELVHNLTKKINWYKTVQTILEKGIDTLIECGAGKDLKKISRFIEGDYKLRLVHKI